MLGASPPPPPSQHTNVCKIWTHQAYSHIHTTPLQIFPCLTKVNIWCRRWGSNLYHTSRAEFELYKKVWVLDKPRLLLTQVTQVLRVGYLNSNDLMINCIQLALEWRVPLMNLLSVKFFAPWLLFITSNIYIYQNSTCFIFSNSIQYAAINCGIFTLPKDCS